MSSPIGHSLAGYVIAAYRSASIWPRNAGLTLLYLLLANAPDLDFIPGMLVGQPNRFHHGISHSIGAGIMAALVVTLLIRAKTKRSFKREFAFTFLIYLSHLLLDIICVDGRPPLGIPLLWPLSETYFMFPLLPPVTHSVLDHATIGQFFRDAFSLHNLYVIGLEIMVTIPFMVFLYLKRPNRQNRKAEN